MRKKNRIVDQITRLFALFLIAAMVIGCLHPAFTAKADELETVEQTESITNDEFSDNTVTDVVTELADTETTETVETEEVTETEAPALTETEEKVEPAEESDTVVATETETEKAPESETEAVVESETETEEELITETEEVESQEEDTQRSLDAVNFINVAPFLPPVSGPKLRLKMKSPSLRAAQNEDPVGLTKQAVGNGDGTYTITLEAWAKGESIIQEVTQATPTDIVCVLDLSSSMMNGFPTGEYTYASITKKYKNYEWIQYFKDNKDKVYYKPSGEDTYYLAKLVEKAVGNTHRYTYSYIKDGSTHEILVSDGSNTTPNIQLYKQNDKTITKRMALSQALLGFLNQVETSAQGSSSGSEDDVDHRVALIGFGTNASFITAENTFVDMSDPAAANQLEASVTATGDNQSTVLPYSGTTHIEKGMEKALSLLEANPVPANQERYRVVVVFTDGIPGEGDSWGNSSSSCADAALGYGDTIKKSVSENGQGATIYTVGIFAGADPTSPGTAYTSTTRVNTPEASAPYANYFMHKLSSNNGTPQNPGKYLSANNTNALKNIFVSIAQEIETGGATTTTLTQETVIKDIVSPSFSVPDGVDEVTLQTAEYTGENQWAAPVAAPREVTATINDKTLDISGFNFSENWVGTVTSDSETSYRGKKLIISFKVKPGENFLGGTVSTNGEKSGMYAPGETEPLQEFVNPKATVPLVPITPEKTTRNIYLSTEDQLANTFSNLNFTVNNKSVTFATLFDGVNNAGVDYVFDIKDRSGAVVGSYKIPAGKTPSDEGAGWVGGSAPKLTELDYTIDSTVSDHDPDSTLEPVTVVGSISLKVFKPVLTYTDKHVYYKGDQIAVSKVVPNVEWKNGGTLDTAAEGGMHTSKPELSYTYSGVSGDKVDQMTDYTVEVESVVELLHNKNLLTEYPNEVTFKRTCTSESLTDAAATAAEAFKIHVYTPALAFADKEAYYGDTVDLTAPTVADTDWKDASGNAAPSPMDNTKPTVTVELTPADGSVNNKNYVTTGSDFDVAAVVKIGETDVTGDLINAGKLTRTCEVSSCGTKLTVTAACAFKVHVKSVTLDVTKKIEGAFSDKTATYAFTVTVTPAQESGLSAIKKSGTLGNNNKIVMDKLPKGATFTVTEAAVPVNYVVSATLNGSPVDVSGTGQGDTKNHTVTGSLTADDNHIVVINKLETIPVTGVDVPAVYLELLIVAGAALGIALIATAKKKQKAKLN